MIRRLLCATGAATHVGGGPLISRRGLLTTGVGLGAVLLVPGLARGSRSGLQPAASHPHHQHSGADAPSAQPAWGSEGLPLVEPEVRRYYRG